MASILDRIDLGQWEQLPDYLGVFIHHIVGVSPSDKQDWVAFLRRTLEELVTDAARQGGKASSENLPIQFPFIEP